MGLIQAGFGAAGGVLADQWREYIYCDALDADTLVVKGAKRTNRRRSSNTKGSDNVISDGSVVAVADGQCMLIVENGEVVDLCAVPGEFVYNTGTEPSVFTGNMDEAVTKTFERFGRRFSFGGDAPQDQRVYYVNTKEIYGNKYGTPTPVPFRVVDERAGIDMDIGVRCNGEYSYRIVDPLLFYKNVCGNVSEAFTRDEIDSQMKSQLLTALQPAFSRISQMGIRYSAVPGHTEELAQALNDVLSEKWRNLRGIEIVEFGVNAISASEEDSQAIKEMQRAAAFKDPTTAAANMAAAQMAAMQAAAGNAGGAAVGFMGMNMAQGAGGVNANDLYAMGAQQQAASGQQATQPAASGQQAMQPAGADAWTCACGARNTGRFCGNCGKPKPQPQPAAGAWSCPQCGARNTGRFCGNCGTPKPDDGSWTCECGAQNTGRFCGNCGKQRP